MIALGCLTAIASWIMSLVVCFSRTIPYPINVYILGGLSLGSGLLTTIGWVIFLVKTDSSLYKSLYVNFYLTIVCSAVQLVCAFVSFLSPNRKEGGTYKNFSDDIRPEIPPIPIGKAKN